VGRGTLDFEMMNVPLGHSEGRNKPVFRHCILYGMHPQTQANRKQINRAVAGEIPEFARRMVGTKLPHSDLPISPHARPRARGSQPI